LDGGILDSAHGSQVLLEEPDFQLINVTATCETNLEMAVREWLLQNHKIGETSV
jgi:hypothetical protein